MIAMPQPLSSPFTDDAAMPTDISKHRVCHSTVMLKTDLNHVTSLFLALPRPLIRRLEVEMEGDYTCCSVCGLIYNGIITREIHPLFHHYFTYDEITELSFSGFHIRRLVQVFRVFFFFFFFKGQWSTLIIYIIPLFKIKTKSKVKGSRSTSCVNI
jgi:hypothetical protein